MSLHIKQMQIRHLERSQRRGKDKELGGANINKEKCYSAKIKLISKTMLPALHKEEINTSEAAESTA